MDKNVQKEKNENLRLINNLQQDNFKYSPYKNFVDFEMINYPDDPDTYMIILKIYAPENENTIYNITRNLRGEEKRHFSLGENEQINELLMKTVMIKPEFSKTEEMKNKYIHSLQIRLKKISNSINDYILYNNKINSKNATTKERIISEDYKNLFHSAFDMYHIIDDNFSVPLNEDDIDGPRVAPYVCVPMKDGEEFDKLFRNYNEQSHRIFGYHNVEDNVMPNIEANNDHFYNMDLHETIDIKKHYKRVFIDKDLTYDTVVKVEPLNIDGNEISQEEIIEKISSSLNRQNKVNEYIKSLSELTYSEEESIPRKKIQNKPDDPNISEKDLTI